MAHQRLLFFGFTSVFVLIVAFCVLAGGYTSFWRSKNRIEEAKTFLTDACQERMNLLPDLIKLGRKNSSQAAVSSMERTAKKSSKILQQVISHKTPLTLGLIKEFEISQFELTLQIIEQFNQLQSSPDQIDAKLLKTVKDRFYAAQNTLFVTGKKYNDEVNYFTTRKSAFFTSSLAKLFGFNKLTYINLSNDLFLPAKEAFAPKT